MHIQSSLSTEFVPYDVEATAVDGTAIDPRSFPARLAFIPAALNADPTEADWHVATWFGSKLAVLVGPEGGVPLGKGDYKVWSNIEAGQENPVGPAGTLRIT